MKIKAHFLKWLIKLPCCLRKKKGTEISNIRNEKGDITTDPMDIKSKRKEYYEQLCAPRFENLDKKINFLKSAKTHKK